MASDPIKMILNMIPYGAFALTSKYEDDVNAMFITWVTQVSFIPRRLAVGLQNTSYSYGLVEKSRVFALNLFSQSHPPDLTVIMQSRMRNSDKMTQLEYTLAPETACPILSSCAAYIECRVTDIFDFTGDHNLIVAEPIGADIVNKPQKPGAKDILSLVDLNMKYGG